MAITAKVLFVNSEYLKQYTSLNHSVEESYLSPHIIIAQDKYVHQYLGTRLYEKLKTLIRDGEIGDAQNEAYKTLLDDHVRDVTMWWTMVEAIPSLNLKIDNGGLVVRTSEDSTPAPTAAIDREINRARDNAHYYTERMVEYLCNNDADLPEYLDTEPGDLYPERDVTSIAGFEIQQGTSYRGNSSRRREYIERISRE